MTDILAGRIGDTFNIHSESRDPASRLLSNFAARPFELSGRWFASVEGFIQGIKLREYDKLRYRAFASTGSIAKAIGEGIRPHIVVFHGKRRSVATYGSVEHHDLIAWAIGAKFDQNTDCMAALLSTKGLTLTHDTGTPESPDTSLPANVFCGILTEIRNRN